MIHATFDLRTAVAGLCALLCTSGCGGSAKITDSAASAGQLTTIAAAYAKATESLDRPPMNKAELMDFVKELVKEQEDVDPADVFRSKVDGQEFVIHWGVDYRNM